MKEFHKIVSYKPLPRNKSISLQAIQNYGPNKTTNSHGSKAASNNHLSGNEGAGVIRDENNGGDSGGQEGEGGGGQGGGGEGGGFFQEAQQAELLSLGKQAQLLNGRQGEAELLGFG